MRFLAVMLSVCVVASAGPPPPPTGSIVGIVTDDTRTVAHATLRLSIEGRDPIYVESDAAGKYRVDAVEPGGWNVSVTAIDHVTGGAYVEVVAGREVARDIALRSDPLFVVEGVISDADGPVEGARVEGLDASNPQTVAATLTTADGHYTLAVGEQYQSGITGATVSVRRAGSAPVERKFNVARHEYRKTESFMLVPGGALAGVVRDTKTHAPVPNAMIEVRRDTAMSVDRDGTGPSRTISADSNGNFKLVDLIASTYELRACVGTNTSSPLLIVTVGTAEHIDGLEVVVAKR